MQKVTFCLRAVAVFWLWCLKIAPVVRGTFLVVVAGMRRSFGGNDILRMSFSGFFRICEVRASSGAGGSPNYMGSCRYPACCVVEPFKGRRCADRKKRCIVSLDVLGKLQIRNPSGASLVCAGGRLHGEEAPARK